MLIYRLKIYQSVSREKLSLANVVKLGINRTLDKTDDNGIKKVDFNDLANSGGPS